MPGYVIHIAVAQEYLKKHNMKYSKDFIKGSVAPDFTKDKSKTHYGKSPAYTSLKNFLLENNIDTDYNQGYFLHLVTDYLFYNKYMERIKKPQIYIDYDCTNKDLIEKYNVKLIDSVKDKVFFLEGEPKILTLNLAYKVIEEISSLSLKIIEKEVIREDRKWNSYKNIV